MYKNGVTKGRCLAMSKCQQNEAFVFFHFRSLHGFLVQDNLVKNPLVQRPLVQQRPLAQYPLVQHPLAQDPLVQHPLVRASSPVPPKEQSLLHLRHKIIHFECYKKSGHTLIASVNKLENGLNLPYGFDFQSL